MDEPRDPPWSDHTRGVFEGRVLTRLDSIEIMMQDIKMWMSQQEARLRSVEQEQSKAKGIAMIVGALAGIITALVGIFFKR